MRRLRAMWARQHRPSSGPYTIGLFRTRLEDDAGKSVALDIEAVLNADLPDWVERRRRAVHQRTAVLATSISVIGIFIALPLLPRSATPFLGFGAMAVLMLLGTAISIRLRWPRLWRRWLRPAYIEIGRCPACAYELNGMDPDRAGRLNCPECGGSWDQPSEDEIRIDDPELIKRTRPQFLIALGLAPVGVIVVLLSLSAGWVMLPILLALVIPLGVLLSFRAATRRPPPVWICDGCGRDLRGHTEPTCPACRCVRAVR